MLNWFRSRKRLIKIIKDLRKSEHLRFVALKESLSDKRRLIRSQRDQIDTEKELSNRWRDRYQEALSENKKLLQYKDKYYKLIAAIKINGPELLLNEEEENE